MPPASHKIGQSEQLRPRLDQIRTISKHISRERTSCSAHKPETTVPLRATAVQLATPARRCLPSWRAPAPSTAIFGRSDKPRSRKIKTASSGHFTTDVVRPGPARHRVPGQGQTPDRALAACWCCWMPAPPERSRLSTNADLLRSVLDQSIVTVLTWSSANRVSRKDWAWGHERAADGDHKAW